MLFIENHTSHRRVASFAWRRLLVPRFPGGDGLFFQAGLIELSRVLQVPAAPSGS